MDGLSKVVDLMAAHDESRPEALVSRHRETHGGRVRLGDILNPLQDGDVVGVTEPIDVRVIDDELVRKGLPTLT